MEVLEISPLLESRMKYCVAPAVASVIVYWDVKLSDIISLQKQSGLTVCFSILGLGMQPLQLSEWNWDLSAVHNSLG